MRPICVTQCRLLILGRLTGAFGPELSRKERYCNLSCKVLLTLIIVAQLVCFSGCGRKDGQLKSSLRTPDSPENMVLVPAGRYSMGKGSFHSGPSHFVNVPAFYIDKYEVTNTQYKAFCDSTQRDYPPIPTFVDSLPDYFTNSTYSNYPVVNVSWNDAEAYVEWAHKRLPTEAEWERAAKGDKDGRHYPWGDFVGPDLANLSCVVIRLEMYGGGIRQLSDYYSFTSQIGRFPDGRSPVGCYDMVGNVWEWCEDDWHDDYNAAPADGSAWINNPRDSCRVVRGGSWAVGDFDYVECTGRYRDNALQRSTSTIGFRCAKTP